VKLSRNNQLVLDALEGSGRSMGAYELIEAVRPHGLTAPPTVYRALTKLTELGFVHRVESSNTFVACNGKHGHNETIMLMVCGSCSRTNEFPQAELHGLVAQIAARDNFKIDATVLEVKGTCSECQSARPD